MNKQYIQELVEKAILHLQQSQVLPSDMLVPQSIQIDIPKDRQHGDYATNVALILAKLAKRNPRDMAALIIEAVNTLPTRQHLGKIEVAGPGFINFFLDHEARHRVITDILTLGEKYGWTQAKQGQRILVEFVSTNPTGPLHVGHGRQGAYGSVVAAMLATQGYEVTREYYINDAGRQMDILAASVWVRYLEPLFPEIPFPANAYRGEYVIDIANALRVEHGKSFVFPLERILTDLPLDAAAGGDSEQYIDALIARMKTLLGDAQYEILFQFTLNYVMEDIRDDLAASGVQFESWFSERAFTRTDAIDRTIAQLQAQGLTFEQEGALWFRATAFGDEKDRVLQRANGARTYFANDLAYHVNKFERGFDQVIDIFGADHHGYLPRMRAGLRAFGISPERISFLLLQFVTLYRQGEQVQMSTRSGSFVTLRELREEVGADATRFFYLQRRGTQHIDFDLDLAKSESNENPVYYIQYAYARICSVFRQLKEKNLAWDFSVDSQLLPIHLGNSHETELLAILANYPERLANAANHCEPQILTNYLRELVHAFHGYYNACQFIVDDAALRHARLALIAAVRQVIANGLGLLGISTPEKM